MFSNMTDTIKCCSASLCGAWRVNEEQAPQQLRNKHSIRYYRTLKSYQLINFLFGHAHFNEFQWVISPSHSLSVWEYNYTQNAYSSLCLSAACSVRCISHEAEEMRCVSRFVCQLAWLSVRPPLGLSTIRQQVICQAGDYHLVAKNKQLRFSKPFIH